MFGKGIFQLICSFLLVSASIPIAHLIYPTPSNASRLFDSCASNFLDKAIGYDPRFHQLEAIRIAVQEISQDPEYALSARDQSILNIVPNTMDRLEELRKKNKVVRKMNAWLANIRAMKSSDRATRKIIAKILHDPKAVLTPEETTTLSTSPSLSLPEKSIREVARTHGKQILAIKRTRTLSQYAATLLFGTGVVQSFFMENPVSASEWKVQHEKLQPDEFELVYFPVHVAIHVGDHYYDYNVRTVRKDEVVKDGHIDGGSTRVRFKVTPQEIKQLQQFLESEVGNEGMYYFGIHFTSCVSNAERAIGRTTSISVPDGLDRSLAYSQTWFKFQKLRGDPKIEGIYHVGCKIPQVESTQKFVRHVINIGDSALSMIFLPEFIVAAQWDRTPWGYSYIYGPNKTLNQRKH